MIILLSILFVILIVLLVCVFYKPKREKYLEINKNAGPGGGSIAEQQQYSRYNYHCMSPWGYHRYQSNLCDPTQDELPITFPDPNADLEPEPACSNSQKARIQNNLKYGSESCGC